MRDLLRVRVIDGAVTTDDILPARHLARFAHAADLAPHVFEDRLPGFADTIGAGDLIVARLAIGVGRSRERTVAALRACGVRMVLAPDIGHAFFRDCWNLGVPAIRADLPALCEGAEVAVDVRVGIFSGACGLLRFTPPPPALVAMAEAGGRRKAAASSSQDQPTVSFLAGGRP